MASWGRACISILAFVVPATSATAREDLVLAVIVGNKLPLTELSFGDLRHAYRGYAVYASGKKLIPLGYRKDTPERIRFDETVLGMNPEEVALYWIDRKIRGLEAPSRNIESPAVLLRVVSKVEGAIGYVRMNEKLVEGVKVIKIDGKLPGDAGYRIR